MKINLLFIVRMMENTVYCDICDSLCIQRFYKNHLKSKTHINNIRNIEQLDKSFQIISLI